MYSDNFCTQDSSLPFLYLQTDPVPGHGKNYKDLEVYISFQLKLFLEYCKVFIIVEHL